MYTDELKFDESIITKILNYYNFENITSNEQSVRACCKLHNGDNSSAFVIDCVSGLWFCHTNCGGGNIFQLIQKLENISYEESINRIKQFLNINPNTKFKSKPKYIKETEHWIKIMSKNIKFNEYMIPVYTKQVNKFRNFNEETLKKFELQYAPIYQITKKNKEIAFLRKRLVIPIYFDNILIGVSLRRINKNDQPKWFHQPTGIKLGNVLYNYSTVLNSDEIIIVEGIFDVWRYYQSNITNVIATFGSHISDEQIKLLLKTPATKISLSYDSDKAGIETTKKAIQKLKNKFIIKQIILPPNKDPCDCNEKELYQCYKERRKV